MYTYEIEVNGTVINTGENKVEWFNENIKLARSDSHSVISEYVTDVTFIKTTRDYLLEIIKQYAFKEDVKFRVFKEDDSTKLPALWASYVFDFSVFEDDGDTLKVGLIEDSIRAKVESCSDVEYEITIPDTDLKIINYQGVKKLSRNLVQALAGQLIERDVYEWHQNDRQYYSIRASRTIRDYSDSIVFIEQSGEPYEAWKCRCIKAGTFTFKINIDNLIISMDKATGIPLNGRLKALHRRNNSNYENPVQEWILAYGENYDYRSGFYLKETYTGIYAEITVNMIAGQVFEILYLGDNDWGWGQYWISKPSVGYSSSENNYFEITTLSDSAHNNKNLKGLTHQSCCDLLLKEIVGEGNYTLTWKPSFNFTDIICSSRSLRLDNSGIVNISMEDLFKSLKTFGITYDISGSEFIVDYRRNMYQNTLASSSEFKVIGDPTIEAYTQDSFNQVKVGYSVSDDDKVNGKFAFCATNTFVINQTSINKDSNEKTLELISPFIADAFSIEDYMDKVEEPGQKDNRSDNRNFIFACAYDRTEEEIPYYLLIKGASYYVGTPSGQFDPLTMYNIALSPKRLLLANLDYISVSGIGKDYINFASSERDANVSSQMIWESGLVTENLREEFIEPLFFPATVSFDSVHNYSTLNELSIDKHKKFCIFAKKHNRYFYFFLKNLDISVGLNQSQSIEGILHDF